ncbi:type II secretion system F family protein [Gudongella oleilytica]|uniref:type II secretion system F family protein n=1 Tax=Gudongella oleilytica TaxID=1582259 RepID=UPI0019D0D8C2|nr:type II secretion system F family protein [Gudongella oleilytica]
MKYKYRAIAKNGQTVEGVFDAASESDVIAMIKANSYMPLQVERDVGEEARFELFKKKVKKKDLAVFCRQFFTMIDAGLGIVKCLDILEIQTENKTLKAAVGVVNEDVQKGLALSEGMKKHSLVFPSILTSMVEAGEVSGNLDAILERMAVHFEKENKIENKVKSSMIYPAALAVVSVAVVVFMLVFVMPTFVGMFTGSGVPLPGPTRLLLGISDSIKTYWYLYAGALIAISTSLGAYMRTDEGRLNFDKLKLRLPVVKDTTAKVVTSRFTRTLSTLMDSGIPLIKSMEVVSRVVNNKVIEGRLLDGIEQIRKGVPLSRSIKDVEVFPPMVDSMIKIGEESGSLDDILMKTADFYDEEVEVALTKLTSLLEPIMIVFMAIMIGFIVIAMYLPMFDMMQTV